MQKIEQLSDLNFIKLDKIACLKFNFDFKTSSKLKLARKLIIFRLQLYRIKSPLLEENLISGIIQVVRIIL